MLKINNSGPIEFKKYAKTKRIYIWGAGRALESCLEIYFSNQTIQGVFDSNSKLWGSSIQHYGANVTIGGKELLCQHIKQSDISNCLLMITSAYYGPEIVDELDTIPELDGLECFLQAVIRTTKENIPAYSFTNKPC